RGRGRQMLPAGALLVAAAFGLAGLPPFGPFLGTALVEQAAGAAGYGWLPAVLALAAIVSAGALVRAAGRIFLGAGGKSDALLARQPEGAEAEEADAAAPHRNPVRPVPPLPLLPLGWGFRSAPGSAGQPEQPPPPSPTA